MSLFKKMKDKLQEAVLEKAAPKVGEYMAKKAAESAKESA